MIGRAVFGHEVASIPEARRFALRCIGPLPAALVDTLGLIVSELATNAVLAGTGFELNVERSESQVTVAVSDHGGGQPQVRPLPGPRKLHGRGLRCDELSRFLTWDRFRQIDDLWP